jgi:hypothetical protein
MAYDETLAARVRGTLGSSRPLSEKKMFGGLAFLLSGNMCCGIIGSDLIVRLGPAAADAALGEPGVRRFDPNGRPMKAWIVVADTALAGDALSRWLLPAASFAATLPPK